jgi:integrase
VRQRLRGILDYAVEHGLITINPLPVARRGAKIERKHLPAVLTHEGIGAILRAADQADASRGVRRAHLLCAFTAQRIGEIVGAQWGEFDLVGGTWAIPRARMKRKDPERGPHQIPLPPGLLAMLREWHRADGEGAIWVCPAPRADAPVTREAVEKFYNRALGLTGQHGPHGWRSVFSTWSYEAGDDRDTIEAQLDHVTGGKVQVAYDRGARVELRRKLIAKHEQRLIAARDGAKVVSISGRSV